jgi:ABC-type transporter Mla subunit MlaD
MSKRIERNEIAEKGVLDNLLEPLKVLIGSLDEADKKLQSFADTVKNSVKSADDAKGMRELEQSTQSVNKAFENKLEIDKQREKLTKDIEKAEAKLLLMQEDEYKQLQELNEEIKKQNKLKKKTEKLTDEEIKNKIALQKASKKLKQELADELILNDKNAGTLEKIAASNRKLRREREQLNLDTEEGANRLKEINLELDKNNDVINENSDKLKKQKLNVGNYTESIEQATGELGGMIGSIRQSIDGIKNQITEFRNASKATDTFRGKAKLLGKTLKSLGIGAIVAVIGAMGSAISDTRKGAELFEGTFQKITETVKTVGSSILNFFKKIPLQAEKFALEIKKIFQWGDDAEKTQQDIDNLQNKIDELNKSSKDFGDTLDENLDNLKAYRKSIYDLEDAKAQLSSKIAELQGQEERLSESSGDMTLSFDEQREAQEKYLQVLNERVSTEKELAQLELNTALLNIRQQLLKSENEYTDQQILNLEFLDDENDRMIISSERLAQLSEAKSQLIEKDQELLTLQQKSAMERRNIEKDDFEKQLDYAIDAFDVNKTLNERIINLEQTTLEERDRLTEKTRQLADKSFQNQIALVEDYTKQKIDFEKLIALQDEEAIRNELAKNNLNETTLTRILEIIKERKIAIQDLSDLELDTAQKRLDMNQKILESEQNIDQDSRDLKIEKLQQQLEIEQGLEEQNLTKISEIYEQIKQEKISKLEDIADFDRQIIEQSVMEEAEKAQKIKEINDILANDIERINMETLDVSKKANEEAVIDYKQAFNDIKSVAIDAYNDMTDNAIDALKKQEEASAQMYDALAQMASTGNITAQQSLAQQVKAQEDAQKAQMELEKKKQKMQLISQGLDVFGSFIDAGDNPQVAVGKTGVSMTSLIGLINSLPSFFVGTEDTGKNGKGVDGKGGFVSILHPNERVMTAEQNAMTKGLSNPMLADVAWQYKTGNLVPKSNDGSFAVVSELVALRRAVEEQPQMITGLEHTLSGMMKLIVTEKKGNHKNTNTYKS